MTGVIGHPIGHTLSPRMHNAAFAADGTNWVYVAMDARPEALSEAVRGLSALGFAGFNVTMPHKERILPLLDTIEGPARIAGAVNTVVVREGTLHGMNTDGSGFVEACAGAGVDFAGERVLVLGAGGAAAAVAAAVLENGAVELVIANRTLERAEELRVKLSGLAEEADIRVRSLEGLEEETDAAGVIINTTYLGMKGHGEVPLPGEALGPGKTVCDAVYNRNAETGLIRRTRESGARVVPGELMLLYQGVQAQRAWTGREPNIKAMRDALLG